MNSSLLRNCGNINPLEINEYIAKDGYQALAEILTSFSPQQVIDEVTKSGLKGRGGGGFSTGKKWQFAKNSESDQKYGLNQHFVLNLALN